MSKLAQVFIGNSFYNGSHNLQNLSSTASLVTFVINLSFVVGGVLVLFIGLIGGFQVIMGAGSGNPDSAAKGKKAVTYAIMGFIIIFVSYWIIRFIEVITGVTFVTNPPF